MEEEAWPERIKVLQLRPLCAGVLREAGVELAAFGAPRSSDLWRFRLPRVEGAVVSPFVFCGISVPPLRRHRAVVSSGGGFRSVGGCGGGVLLAVVVCCDLRLHPPLSGVCSVAGGSPGGFVQELVCGVGLRRFLLRSAAKVYAVCWWTIWCRAADGGRCWIWWGVRPCHARSSSMIPSTAAGGSRLKLWRSSLPQVLWWPAFFFASDAVAAKFGCQACWLFCSDLRLLAVLPFAIYGLYGVRLLRCLYPFLC